jgi:hypothetical protein
LGFGVVEAAEGPFAADEVVDEGAGRGGGGVEALVILVDELLELGAVFVREDEGFGVDAGPEAVHGGSGLACDRGGASGLLGVTLVGFNLTESRHGSSGQAGGLSCFEHRGGKSGNREVNTCNLLKRSGGRI